MTEDRCPCGRGRARTECCGRLLAGTAHALTAEDLMRSRYTAYAVRDVPYLLATWHPTTRPSQLHLAASTRWLGLTVHATAGGGPLDRSGTVEFSARYAEGDGPECELHEVSRFDRLDGVWLYVSASS